MHLFFDTETTGLPRSRNARETDLHNWPRMVQLAWLLTDESGELIEQNGCLIYPEGFDIPESASRIHGITTAHARQFGIPVSQALERFRDSIRRARLLVAHNYEFDRPVVGAEYHRAGWGENPLHGHSYVCTMKASTAYCRLPGPYGFKWPSLQELHTHLFGRPYAGAHDAVADVQACRHCFFELKRMGIV